MATWRVWQAGNDSSTLHVRSERNTTTFWMCPQHSSLGEADGVFTKHTMKSTRVEIPTPAVKLTKPAAPPRYVPSLAMVGALPETLSCGMMS